MTEGANRSQGADEDRLPELGRLEDLSQLIRRNTGAFMLGQFTGAYDRASADYLRLISLVRFSDKAIQDYESARLAYDDLAANASQGRIGPFLTAIEHSTLSRSTPTGRSGTRPRQP